MIKPEICWKLYQAKLIKGCFANLSHIATELTYCISYDMNLNFANS